MEVSEEQQKENQAFFEATKKMKYDECGHVYLDEGNLLYIFGKGVEHGKLPISTISAPKIIEELDEMDTSIRIVENQDGTTPALLVAYLEIDRIKTKYEREDLSKGKKEVCKCGHTRNWHNRDGECYIRKQSKNVKIGEKIDCKCKQFVLEALCECGHVHLPSSSGKGLRTYCVEGSQCNSNKCKKFVEEHLNEQEKKDEGM